MKCDRCSKRAVAYLKYFDSKLCKDHFTKLTEDRIRRNISKNQLFKPNDRVAVAVSGGKDSITLLRYLHKFSKRMPLKLSGVMIDEGIKGYRDQSIPVAVETFEELEIPYVIKTFKKEFGKTLDQMLKKGDKLPCTYCGVFRRRLLNSAAKEFKANKLATGHNLDDEVQSITMNYFRGDFARMARIGAKTPKQRGYVQRVKPLRDVPEKEIGIYAVVSGYPIHVDECPYVRDSLRADIRDKLNQLEENHPGTKFQILKGSDNLNEILKGKFKAGKMLECAECGERSPAKTCKVCGLLGEV